MSRIRAHGSLIGGLCGVALFALLSCVAVGGVAALHEAIDDRNEIARNTVVLLLLLLASGSYVCTLMTLHLIASSELPLSVRLGSVFALTLGCLGAATWPLGDPALLTYALFALPLCFGGFLQRWRKGWRVLAADQTARSPRMTIATLLDATASIALVLGLLTALKDQDPRGLICFVPGSFMLAMFGMHVWARLCSICPVAERAESGYASWITINIVLALSVFIAIVVEFSTSPGAFIAFIVAPAFLGVTYVWTEIPLRWLRRRGLRFVRIAD